MEDFQSVFTNQEQLYGLVDFIVNFIVKQEFDGIVLEIWSQFGGHYKT